MSGGAGDALVDPGVEEADQPDATATGGSVVAYGYEARSEIERSQVAVELGALCAIAVEVLLDQGVGAGRIDLHLVDTETIAELNAEHMGHAGPTDVLSFPLDDAFGDTGDTGLGNAVLGDTGLGDTVLGDTVLGDIVLCPTVAQGQAADHAGSLRAELALLTIHGVLHVLGHDHAEAEETLAMQEIERRHLARLGHEHPAFR